jgi:hypothetical protein
VLLLVCASCGRRRSPERVPRGVLRCSQCGSIAVRRYRRLKWWLAHDDYDGISEHDAKTLTMARLKWYAEQKGYKPGWASVKYNQIYGVWPNGESKAKPETVSAPLMHWINKQNAAFARIMRRNESGKRNES